MVIEQAWPWIAAAYFLGLSIGLAVWWCERRLRILCQLRSDFLSKRRAFWADRSQGLLRQYSGAIKDLGEARYQAEGYRDAFLSLEDVDAVNCCLPWEDNESWQAKWDDTDEDEDDDD